MENNTKRIRWRLNLFDIVFIICAIVAIALIFFYTNRSGGGTVLSGPNGKVVYTVELQGMIGNTAYLVKPGDSLVDKVEKRPMGTIVAVEVQPATASQKDWITGERIITNVIDRMTAIVTVEAEATVTESQITITGGFIVRVGTWLSVNGPLYNSAGYIVDVERDDAS
ncbi:MAG: DUF4330 domain-containing protein [Oscillospiraceae bacterium]|jgi:hypothetical protein|nr:DUF4330 domain-containing protein [Oscillospiraceae bacterium]